MLLLLLAAACLAGFWYGNNHTEAFRIRYPLFSPRLWNLYLTCSLASVVALVAMWNWRRWGVYLLAVAGIGTLFLEFYAMGFAWQTLRIPLALTAVWFVVQPRWGRFQ
jgi:hypothetical protein